MPMTSNAIQITGTGTYGKILNYAAIDSLGEVTIEGWFKQDGTGGVTYASAWQYYDTASHIGLATENGAPTDGCNFSVDYDGANNADGYKSGGVFTLDTWVHVAFIFDLASKQVFILKNGVPTDSYNLQQVGAGNQVQSTTADFYYMIDGALVKYFKGWGGGYFRVWNRQLPWAEVYENMNLWLDAKKETGLVVNCQFQEGSGATVANDVEGANNMSLTGSPTWGSGPSGLTQKQYTSRKFYGKYDQNSDDAEENKGTTAVDISGSSDLELCYDANSQIVGIRFPSVTIPPKTKIKSAKLKFVAKETQTGNNTVTMYGQAADNPSTFTSTNGDVSGRTKTTASVSWVQNGVEPTAGSPLDSADITTIVQEIVDRAGWASGNAMAFIIDYVSGTAKRTVFSYTGDEIAIATLIIEWDDEVRMKIQIPRILPVTKMIQY